MPKELPKDLAAKLEAEIYRHPDGLGAGELFTPFLKQASRRSLVRILNQLEHGGRIRIKGERRGTRYLPPAKAVIEKLNAKDTVDATVDVYVPLSGDSEMLRNWVRRPITQRRPVGYDRSLLDAYVPNRTYYLSDADWRTRMHEIGRSPVATQAAGTYARDILNRLLIDLSWASSHLEGNTYSRLDTQNLIEQGREAEGKDRLETQMILNHKQAIEFLVENAADIGFDMHTLTNLHGMLAQNLLGDPAGEGRLRARIVDISGTVYRPLQVPQQIGELFRLFIEKAAAIADPFEQAFFAMVHVPYLQPFIDVNKRVSRLAANIPFIKGNLCPLSFVDVPERAYVEGTLAVYEHARVDLLRDVYVWAYERSCQNFKAIAGALPEPDPFRLKYREELKENVVRLVRESRSTNIGNTRTIAEKLVPEADLARFVAMVSRELHNLHEGNIARYGLGLEEYRDWRSTLPKV